MECCKELFSGSAGNLLSAIVGAGCMMLYNYWTTKSENKRKELNDIRSVVTQLGGFINYFQFACHMNSALRSEDYQRIIDRILNVNKEVFDASNAFFYNSQFKSNVSKKISGFLEVYIGWRGYRPMLLTEVFNEYQEINSLQINAIMVLNEIVDEYSDNKELVGFIKNVVNCKDSIEKRCQDLNKKMGCIIPNSTVILYSDDLPRIMKKHFKEREIDIDDVRNKIVCQLFKHIHGQELFQLQDSPFGKALFNEEIQSMCISEQTIVTRSAEGEKTYSYDDVAPLLFRLYIEA